MPKSIEQTNIKETALKAGFVVDYVNHDTLLYSGVEESLTKFAALVRAEALKEQNIKTLFDAVYSATTDRIIAESLAERQDKPAECANGCPENMVCDYCQGAEPMKRPQNCGTGYCSCIECPYEPVKQEQVLVSDVFSFLLGEKPLNGVWFGEKPEGVKGNFWWRTHLRKALAAPVQPVKQSQLADASLEPVGVVESNEEWGVAGVLIAGLPIGTKLYAAPVDAKAIREAARAELMAELTKTWGNKHWTAYEEAIRAEALEEAAKVCEEIMEYGEYPDCEAEQCAAAIRGLK